MLEYTLWKVVDSHWVNVERNYKDNNGFVSNKTLDEVLCLYLMRHGFDIHDSITYCLAESEHFKLKFRVFGSAIHVYIYDNN